MWTSREMTDTDSKRVLDQEETHSLKGKDSGHSSSQQRSEHESVHRAEEEEDKRKIEEEEEGDVHTSMKQRRPRLDRLNHTDLCEAESRVDDVMQKVEEKHKDTLREKFTCVHEGTADDPSRLEKIYTQLVITRGVSQWGEGYLHQYLCEIKRHGVIDADVEISPNDLFRPQPGERGPIKTVLMKGIAGIGKTVAVQKFAIDWAEGKHNRHIDFIFVLPFRELNLIKDVQFSLLALLTYFHPELKQIQDTQKLVDKQILLVFDGLDESRFKLDFTDYKRVSDLTQTASVGVLLTNVIKGSLLPNALLWITSRPAAANQIPPQYLHRTTEVQGFNDQQKEEFFVKKFPGDTKGTISRIKTMISFLFMGHIPIFCWITAEVFQKGGSRQKVEGIATVTELYIHYLLIQTQRAIERYEEQKPHAKDPINIVKSRTFKMFLKLAELAFKQLEQGNIIFYEEDLRKCGLDVSKASAFCGLCSEILKQEHGLYERKMFSFVHLSFQEFLAALYVFHCCVNKKADALQSLVGGVSAKLPQQELMMRVVKKALQSKSGHLDLFLCFFLGMSLESSQTLLQDVLGQGESGSETVEEMRRYLREPDLEEITPERQMNLFLCQYEMKVHSVQIEIKTFIESGVDLSPINQSVLSSMLLMSEGVLDEIDLTQGWNNGRRSHRLLPALKNCRRATLDLAVLCREGSETLPSVLQSADSSLRELHLTGGARFSQGEPLSPLFAALRSPDCKLEILRLSGLSLTPKRSELLASVLQSSDCHLRELDLLDCELGQIYLCHGDKNEDQDDGDAAHDLDRRWSIPAALRGPLCQLETFRMRGCHLTETCCEVLALALRSNTHLTELDLSQNDLLDPGVALLSVALASPLCRLEILRLSLCGVTEKGCFSLASALTSNPSHLRQLDLSNNHPGPRGVQLLSERLEDRNCSLEKLNVDHDEEYWGDTALIKNDAIDLTLNPDTANRYLHPSEGTTKAACRERDHMCCGDPGYISRNLLCREGLTGRGYWEVECKGTVSAGVTHKTISMEEGSSLLDFTMDKSWWVTDSEGTYSVEHNRIQKVLPVPRHRDPYSPELPRRIGVHLDWPAGILSFYRVYSDTVIHLYTFHTTFTEPVHPTFQCLENSAFGLFGRRELQTTPFNPDVSTEFTGAIYRFQCPGPGVFRCRLTGLLFGLEGEGEVLYQTVQWDEGLLQSAGRIPAGPLFSIECPQGSVCQLHLPHCETLAELPSAGLSVAHITAEGVSLLEPLETTSSHVVVNVTHLSSFGLVWMLHRFLFSPKPISGQVLLFLRPPGRQRRRILSVFLLPGNVLFPEVKRQHDEDEYIKTCADCDLTPGQSYSLSCRPDQFTQPEKVQFGLRYGPNYHPTFEVFLDVGTESVTLELHGTNETIWHRQVDLTVTGLYQSLGTGSVSTCSAKIRQRLLAVLKKLTDPQLSEFQWHLTVDVWEDSPPVPNSELENADRLRTVDTVAQAYGAEGAVRITLQVLRLLPRNDLLEELEQSP